MIAKDSVILIVGLGLIGGSYAKGLKKHGYTVYAISRGQGTIDYALETASLIKEPYRKSRKSSVRQTILFLDYILIP